MVAMGRSGMRLVSTIITVVLGVFDCVLKELVFCVCLLGVLLCTRSVYLRDLPPSLSFQLRRQTRKRTDTQCRTC